jgi:hypothetical protein
MTNTKNKTYLFELGQQVFNRITMLTIEEAQKAGKILVPSLFIDNMFRRHLHNDSDICEEDKGYNKAEIDANCGRVVSSFNTVIGKVYLITELGGEEYISRTTLLLASEY